MINPISAAQMAANQANSQKSTGPRTEEGKAKARFNARRHGLTGQFYCMSAEDEDAYRGFETGMLKELRPVGAYETQIAISIVQDHWRLNRSRATEFNLYGRGHDQRAGLVDAPSENTHAAATQADTHRDDHRVFANIALYETRIHRMVVNNEKRLAELQAERRLREDAAREEAEHLVQLADLTGETPEQVGLSRTADRDGFVFSIAEIRAQLFRKQRLADARFCAKYNFNPNEPALKRFRKAA